MTDNNDADAEELLQQSKEQSRHTTEPNQSPSPTVDRTGAIKDALLAIEEGDAPENINVRDKRLKALLVGLDNAGELDEVAEALDRKLDQDTDIGAQDTTQSDVARLLIRLGLQSGLQDVLDDATEARQQALLEQADSY